MAGWEFDDDAFARWLARSLESQGLTSTVVDPLTLRHVRVLLIGGRPAGEAPRRGADPRAASISESPDRSDSGEVVA